MAKINQVEIDGTTYDLQDKSIFTGTKSEVNSAISNGTIKEGDIVNITDDAGESSSGILDSYEEIMANTSSGKVAGALAVKEGFNELERGAGMTEEQANQLQFIYDKFKPSSSLINHIEFFGKGSSFSGCNVGDLFTIKVGSGGGYACELLTVTGAELLSKHYYTTKNGSNTYYSTVALLKTTATSFSFTHSGADNYCEAIRLNSI